MLLRHGKSDWDTTNRGDRNRPLSRRGERASATMGLVLRKMDEVPDRIVSSPALRAEATATIVRLSGGWDSPLEIAEDLYGAGPEAALEVAARCGGDAERLMLVGHEPTWSYLEEHLTGGRIAVRTATVLAFDLDASSWADVTRSRGTLAYALHPRMFDQGEWALQ